MITINQRGPDPSHLSGMLPDETISSWIHRNEEYVCVVARPGSGPRVFEEHDFGKLRLDLPAASHTLLAQLQEAALPPARRVLPPHKRLRFCERCLIEDWASGRPEYNRRSWCVSWRTCCPQHGLLTSRPSRPSLASALGYSFFSFLLPSFPPNSAEWISLNAEKWFHTLYLSVANDKRAMHLEQALCYRGGSPRPTWWPRGFSPNKLFAAYIAILKELVPWEIPADADTEATMDAFGSMRSGERLTANVFAEAILSSWSHTPLPREAGPNMRTELLVRLLGWSIAPPQIRCPDQLLLLLECPTELTDDGKRRCAKYFYKSVQTSAEQSAARIAAFNKVEAQALGLDARDIRIVGALADAGRLGRFDAKRWTLRRSKNAIPLSFIELDVLNRARIRMPEWFRQPGYVPCGVHRQTDINTWTPPQLQ